MWRFVKIGALVTFLLFILLSISLYFFLQSRTFDEWARQQVVQALEERFAVTVELERVDIRILSQQVEVWGLRIHNRQYPAETPAIELDRILLDFTLTHYFMPAISLDALTLERPRLRFIEDPNTRLNIANMFFSEGERPTSGSFSFTRLGIARLTILDGLILYQDQPIYLDSAEGAMSAALQFDPDRQMYSGQLELGEFDFQLNGFGLTRTAAEVTFELFEDRLILNQVDLRSEAVSGSFQGEISDFRNLTYSIQCDLETDLIRLQNPDLSGFIEEGQVRVNGTFSGIRGDFQFEGTAVSDRIRVFSLPFLNVRSPILLRPGSVRVERLTFSLYQGQGETTGTLAWEEGAESRFDVRTSGVRLRPLLNQFAPDLVRAGGFGAFQGQVGWPDLEFERLSGRGIVSYQGNLPGERLPTPEGAVPFAGSSGVLLANRTLFFSDGVVESPNASIRYSGRVNFDAVYQFDVDLAAERGSGLLEMASASGLLPETLLSEYPVEPRGPVTAAVRLERTRQGPRLTGDVESRDIYFRDQLLGDFQSRVTLEESRLVLEDSSLRTVEFQVLMDRFELKFGDVPEQNLIAVDVRLNRFPISRILAFVDTQIPVGGVVTGELRFEEVRPDYFQGSGRLTVDELLAYEEQVSSVSADVILDGQRIEVSDLSGQLEEGSLQGGLVYDFGDGSYQVDVSGTAIPLENIQALRERMEVGGRVTFSLEGSGRLDAPRFNLRASAPILRLRGYPIDNVQLSATGTGTTARFEFSNRFRGDLFTVEGEVGTRQPYPVDATLVADGISVKPYLALFTESELPDLEGEVSGRVTARGPLQDPQQLDIEGNFPAIRLSMEGYEIRNTTPAAFRYSNGTLRLPAVHFAGTDTDLEIRGTLETEEPQRLAMTLEGSANLRILNGFMDAGSFAGLVTLNTTVTGTLKQPRIVGDAALSDGFFFHPSIPTTLYDATGDFKFTASQLSIETFRARTPYGQLNAEGGIFLEGFEPRRWQVNVYGSGLRIEYPQDVVSILDVDVDLLRSERSQLIAGAVYIRSSEYTAEVTIPQLILDYSQRQAVAPSPAGQQETVLDIEVEAYQSIRIDNNLASVVASGDFNLRGTLENPVIVGSLTIDEGELNLEGNRYEVTRGTVTFNDPRRTRPVFNFEATTDVREFTVSILVTGPIEKLNVSFRSDPPLATASIVSLLAVGETQEEIFGAAGSGQSQAGTLAVYGAGELLSKSLGRQVEARTTRLFGLEKFSIDPFHSQIDGAVGAEITVGKQLTRKLSITYSYLTDERQGQIVILEYRLTDWLTAVGTRDNNSIAIDFKLKKRF